MHSHEEIEWPPVEVLLSVARLTVEKTMPDPHLTTQSREDNLDIALAAAARCRRLLVALVAIVEADLHDVAGMLVRSIYECWLTGAYAIRGGEEARKRLIQHNQYQEHQMAKNLKLPGLDEMPKGERLSVSAMATSVTKLLEAENHQQAEFARRAYLTMYAAESHVSTHGGLGSILPYIADDEDRAILSEPPRNEALFRHRFLIAITIVVSAAQVPAVRQGLPHQDLDSVAGWIHSLDPASRQ